MRLGLIGYGSIGQAIVGQLASENRLGELAAVLVRSERDAPAGIPLVGHIDEFLLRKPTVVIEAAGHEAALMYGKLVLRSGADLVISSVGALANAAEEKSFAQAASDGGSKVCIPAGAIAGLDGLFAARICGLDRVTYTSYKPPQAWRGTPAEQTLDFDHPEEEITFFAGSARLAARDYPKNANVSAAIALAGIGFDQTEVRLVSSRKVSGPLGVIQASGEFGWFDFKIFAHAFPGNPKSSMLTAFALMQSARYGTGVPLAM